CQEVAEIRHCEEEERHQEALRLAGEREAKLRRQLERIRSTAGPVELATPSTQIDRVHIPHHFRALVVDPFDGSQDPHLHLQPFQTQAYVSRGDDVVNCKLFPNTLKGVVHTHFQQACSSLYVPICNESGQKNRGNLFDIKQAKGKSLKK
ncbi:hypothetical protein CR513_52260, partial [Mucuna pruriens]